MGDGWDVLDSVSDLVQQVSADGRLLRVNAAWRAALGYAPSEPLPPSVMDVVAPDDHPHCQALFARLMAGEQEARDVAVTFLGRDGRRLALEGNVTCRTRADGTRVTTGVFRDVSARQRAIADLERFFTVAIDLLCIADGQGRFRRLNPAWTHCLGWSLEELAATPFLDFVHPDDRAATEAELGRLMLGARTLRFENRYRTRDGAYRRLLWTAVPYPAEGLVYAAARDVTDLRAQQQALVDAHALQGAMLASADFTIIATDPTGMIRSFNAAAERHLGWRADEVVGRARVDALHDAAELGRRPGVEALLGRAGDGTQAAEWTYVRRDGGRFPVALSVTAMRGPAGDLLGYLCIGRDISARRQAESTLRSFYDSAPVLMGVVELTPDDIVHVSDNAATARFFGTTRERLAGQRASALGTPPEALARWRRAYDEASRSGAPVRFDYAHPMPDGPRWLSVTVARLAGHAAPTFCYVAEDVTSRRRVEEELRASEAHHRAVLDQAVSAIITIDELGQVLAANRAAERLFGWSAAELIGQNVCRLMPEPFRSEHDGYLARYRREGGPRVIGFIREVTGQRRDGTTFPAELAVSEVRLDDGRYFTGLVSDISDRKAAERAKNEFISTVSHELRTPLTSIRGALGLIEAGVLGEVGPEALEAVVIARNNADRLIRLINDILDIEKMQAGKLELRLTELDAREVMEEVARELAPVTAAAEVRVDIDAAPGLRLKADRDRLAQALTNLLSNAAKFSPPGARVRVHARATRGARLRFEVVDEGPGIAPEDRGRLFTKFQQLDSTDTRRRGGTGLGLAICKAIVEQHGGAIGVDGAVGRGSAFWFELPGLAPASAPPGGDVLIVEDELDLAETLAALVHEEGHASRRVGTLADARAALAASRPATVLLDLHLPDGDGLRLLDELARLTPVVPVIILTARPPCTDDPGGALLVDWLVKPFDPDRLGRALRTAADRATRST